MTAPADATECTGTWLIHDYDFEGGIVSVMRCGGCDEKVVLIGGVGTGNRAYPERGTYPATTTQQEAIRLAFKERSQHVQRGNSVR